MEKKASIKLGRFIAKPEELVTYYLIFTKDIKGFFYKIDYNEEIKDSGLFFIILAALSALITSLISLDFMGFLYGVILSPVALAIASGVTYLIGLLCKAKIDFTNSVNMCVHSFVLLFPLSLLASLIPQLSVFSFLGGLAIWAYVLTKVFEASPKRVLVTSIFIGIFFILPMACSMMFLPVLNSTSKDMPFKGAANIMQQLETFSNAADIGVPCLKEEDSDNPHWQYIKMTSMSGIALSADESKDNKKARALIEHIDSILSKRSHKLTPKQVRCVKSYQKSITDKFL